MLNQIVLTGRLTADPEVVQKGERKRASITLAVDRGYKDESGKKVTDFFYITAWNGTAELLGNYCHKGDLIGIEGSLRTFKKQKEGEKAETQIQIIANRIAFLSKKKSESVNPVAQNVNDDDDDFPF